ncbi:DUF3857 domain-containing protein [Flavobacterium sasangense]|uniref:DUF3857 domain-containing protein n=1 Tax=Flavobacterium sasangense TaxID=503361 RepID=UPI00047B7106|nr:DUF3857 domain-containing protein [Flavobacterium sasangense]
MKKIFFLFIFLLSISIFSQENIFTTILIPKELTENANSVVRNQKIDVEIFSKKNMTIKKYKVVTVLNSKGLGNIDAIEYYDKSTSVKSIEAIIYNSFGKEIKKIKRKDFIDQSVADGFSVYSDDRKLFLDYIPIEYPFTIVYTSELETSNTAFLPKWLPLDDFYESIENSSITIKYMSGLGFKYKEKNFNNYNISKQQDLNQITYRAVNIVAQKREELSPSFKNIYPSVLFGLDFFSLEGVEGNATTWEEFGKWRYKSLLSDNEEVSIQTQNAIRELVKDADSPIEKAKRIYEYVQNKTRYVSIQVGIGGWKPMLVSDVDRLGYGDCKALTNYTRVLLKTVGVNSYYTVVYGGEEKISFETDFVSMQGNHIILALPVATGYIFLECTSQTSPFGFNGNFTDDRYALIVKPEGGEIVKTTNYNDSKNKQIISGTYTIDATGNLSGFIQIKSSGIQYDVVYPIEKKSNEDKESYYKNRFSWIKNLKIKKINQLNDKEKIEFTEDVEMMAQSYATISNDLMIVPLNVFNRYVNIPQRYKERKNSFEVSRGFHDNDITQINFPNGYVIDGKFDNVIIESTFGKYKLMLDKENENFVLKREFILNNGVYDKSEYENYRKFMEQIAKSDNSKIILKKA